MQIQLLAHRGGMGRAPENTLASFKQALADGADGYECDVCLTQDKHLSSFTLVSTSTVFAKRQGAPDP